MQTQISLLIESLLHKSLAKMILFVRNAELKISKTASHEENRSKIPNADTEMQALAAEFSRNWTTVIQYIVSSVNRFFPERRSAALCKFIMQQTLAQLVFYHQRFTDIVNSCYVQAPFRSQMIGTRRLVVEIHKHTRSSSSSSSSSLQSSGPASSISSQSTSSSSLRTSYPSPRRSTPL